MNNYCALYFVLKALCAQPEMSPVNGWNEIKRSKHNNLGPRRSHY